MMVRVLQHGFNFSQDGPGNRLVYHLQGCNMRCPWCSNPEGMDLHGCILASGADADALCPFGAVRDGMPDAARCGTCDKPCLSRHDSRLRLSCREMAVQEIVRQAESAALLFFDGGGVTFTGGEATVQFDALDALLTALHERNIHTALETNGSHPALPTLFDRIDCLIVDCKHWDDDAHQNATGVSNRQTIANIRAAARSRTQLLVRIPLIGRFNDSESDAAHFADTLSCLRETHDVELLRYHEYGRDKWKQCGKRYAMRDAFVSDETFRAFRGILLNAGLHLIST